MTENKKRENRRVAAVSTLAIHLGMFIIMFFLVAWVAPDPPLGGNGVFLNLGLADEGSGDYQPETAGDGGKSNEEAAKSEEQSPPPQESEDQPIDDNKADAKEVPTETQSESQVESPVTVTPTKKDEVKPTEPKKADQPKDQPAQVKPQVNPSAVYDPNAKKSSTTTTAGAGKAGQAGNEGDDAGKTGDKGDPRGVKEGTVYEGNPGKGGPGPGGDGGFGLSMSGWTWDEKPNAPKVDDNESGFVVFKITVNEQGNIDKCEAIEYTLSPATVQRCKDKIYESSMKRTGGIAPKLSTGTVRFELRVK